MIEKVGYTKPVTSARGIRRTGQVDAAAFASALERAEAVAGAEPASPVAPLTGVGLLGIQEVSDQDVQRRKAVKRGRFTLEALEKLRDGLLMGSLPLTTLRNLEKLIAAERDFTTDPRLNAILDEIELRAAVEMAKLEVAGLLPKS